MRHHLPAGIPGTGGGGRAGAEHQDGPSFCAGGTGRSFPPGEYRAAEDGGPCQHATLQKKEKAGEPFALFYLDLDSFKPVNDTYGHDVGDQLLKAVSRRLRTCVRSTDYAFRIGGDEFALIVNGALSEEFCAKRTERIKKGLTQPFFINGQELHIGTSCGSALYPADSTEVKEIRILADQRMYEDKAHKPGRGER